MELNCPLCGSSNFIFDEKRDELYCSMCGYVVNSIAAVLEVKYDMLGLNNLDKKVKLYRRIERYKKKKSRERLVRKFEKIVIMYGKNVSFDEFLNYCYSRGIKNNNISRHMEKLFLEFLKVKA